MLVCSLDAENPFASQRLKKKKKKKKGGKSELRDLRQAL